MKNYFQNCSSRDLLCCWPEKRAQARAIWRQRPDRAVRADLVAHSLLQGSLIHTAKFEGRRAQLSTFRVLDGLTESVFNAPRVAMFQCTAPQCHTCRFSRVIGSIILIPFRLMCRSTVALSHSSHLIYLSQTTYQDTDFNGQSNSVAVHLASSNTKWFPFAKPTDFSVYVPLQTLPQKWCSWLSLQSPSWRSSASPQLELLQAPGRQCGRPQWAAWLRKAACLPCCSLWGRFCKARLDVEATVVRRDTWYDHSQCLSIQHGQFDMD